MIILNLLWNIIERKKKKEGIDHRRFNEYLVEYYTSFYSRMIDCAFPTEEYTGYKPTTEFLELLDETENS